MPYTEAQMAELGTYVSETESLSEDFAVMLVDDRMAWELFPSTVGDAWDIMGVWMAKPVPAPRTYFLSIMGAGDLAGEEGLNYLPEGMQLCTGGFGAYESPYCLHRHRMVSYMGKLWSVFLSHAYHQGDDSSMDITVSPIVLGGEPVAAPEHDQPPETPPPERRVAV